MKTIVIYILACVLLVIGLVWLSNPKKVNYSDGELVAKEEYYDFAKVSLTQGKVRHKFVIANPSQEAVEILKIYTSCMCTTALLFDSQGQSQGEFGMPGHGLNNNLDDLFPICVNL